MRWCSLLAHWPLCKSLSEQTPSKKQSESPESWGAVQTTTTKPISVFNIKVVCAFSTGDSATPLVSVLCFQSVNTGCPGAQRGIHLFLHLQQVKQSLCACITVPTLPFPVQSAPLSLPFSNSPEYNTHTLMEAMNPNSHKGPSGEGCFLPTIHFNAWQPPGAFNTLAFYFPVEKNCWIYFTLSQKPLDGLNAPKTGANLWLWALDFSCTTLSAKWRVT